ncbi:NACHT domain-containing protein [Streptomyces sp. NPDC101393]|uniref:NACHT domain-containing protein n=1 Tax=Streptomyces sp. NPDC101393 TaxID=3366141 RepID=UPI00382EE6DF
MDYDLTRLGTREFEHLTQALALRVFGAGVEVFGDGPDGGREAAFRGRTRYPAPDPEEPWDGYGVLQSKFRARPMGTEMDTAWFLSEAKRELNHWANPRSKRAKERELPQYLLFATNVVLSPVAGSGGIDTVKREIENLITELKLPIEGFKVWHFDQLCAFLDLYPEIRQPYEALVTAGDVLAHLRRLMEGSGHADVAERATTYAVMQLAADRRVRLHQAGEGDNQRLDLADIAIDLKVVLEDLPSTQSSVGAAAVALGKGDRILRPSRLEDVGKPHCVILGGPGQGKTTLSQLICQAYRVAFLSDSPELLSAAQQAYLNKMQKHLIQIGLPIPSNHRWPARIDLAAYSDMIAGGESVSILQYLAQQVNKSAPEVNANQLRSWLRKWPWLLVLDGLDEVPSNHSRQAVIEKLDEFYTEAHQLDADLFVVATSRPQGYRREFDGARYEHLALLPLEPNEAISYAERLTEVRFPGDPENARQVFERLKMAGSFDLTARLMRSPLQVTIMSVLLERRERVPQERYRLFDAYYETIYGREVGKPGSTGRLLDQHKVTIDRIHQLVGLNLHVLAERVGEHDASISFSQLEEITLKVLGNAGYDDPKSANRLATKLVTAATTRLVLLSPRGEGVGFDVRSLQEFMAAQALVRDQAADISERLSVIARSAHWRNTWLLAAGNVFFHQGRQRHNLMSLLRELQTDDDVSNASFLVKPGSVLALELLDDDVAAATPRFRRLLLLQALELLDSPPEVRIIATLARALVDAIRSDPGCKQLIFQEIEKSLASTGVSAVCALALLTELKASTSETGFHARRLLEEARKGASPALLAVGEIALECWPRGKSEESNRLLAEVLGLDDSTDSADALWAYTEWARDHSVDFVKNDRDVWVADLVTGSGGDPARQAEIPEIRTLMVESANRMSVENAVISVVLRNWLAGWMERQPCGSDLLEVFSRDEEEE